MSDMCYSTTKNINKMSCFLDFNLQYIGRNTFFTPDKYIVTKTFIKHKNIHNINFEAVNPMNRSFYFTVVSINQDGQYNLLENRTSELIQLSQLGRSYKAKISCQQVWKYSSEKASNEFIKFSQDAKAGNEGFI